MPELKIDFERPQALAYQAIKPGNTVCLPWGRGGGKSWFLRTCLYLQVAQWEHKKRPGCLTYPGVRIVILMPTLEQFRKVHQTLMLTELETDWKFLGGVPNKSTFRFSFPGGSWIQVVSAEAAEGSRGIRCDVVAPDECDDIDPEIVESITQPWFTEPHSLRITLLGGTPKRGRYGLLYRADKIWPKDERLSKTHFSFHATSYDFPKHVDAAYLDEIKGKTDPRIFRREYMVDYDSAQGLVFDMFEEDFHVREPDPRILWQEILVGQDWGYEDPGVQLVVGIQGSGKDLTCFVLEETYVQHKTLDYWTENTKAIKKRYGRYPIKWYADPSQPASIAQINRNAGVHITGADNAIEDGISAVADKFLVRVRRGEDKRDERYARLYVDPKCKNLIRELGLYRRKRDPSNKEQVLEQIVDKDNHTIDALRYALFSRFGKPESVRMEFGPNHFTRT